MSDRLIVNSSPLILLSAVDGVDWLRNLGRTEPIIVPRAVIEEIRAGAGGGGIVGSLEKDPHFAIESDLPLPQVVRAWDLGCGESQVLARCLEQASAIAVLDDKSARQGALSMNIGVVGTLGIVLAAKRRGWIPAARPVLEFLVEEKMYLSAGILTAALRAVGE